MIVICDPVNKHMSHEKVNSGFIYGLSLVYPHETIRLYADADHIETIKNILSYDKITIDDIEYKAIKLGNSNSIMGMITYYFLFKKLFSATLESGTNKIFMLTMTPTLLYIIKMLKKRHQYVDIKFSFVLHGSFENIADKGNEADVLSLPVQDISNKAFVQKILKMKLMDIPRKAKYFIAAFFQRLLSRQWIAAKLFTDKKMLLWNHSPDFRYVSLSPHIAANAEKYIDIKQLNMHTVILPTVFAESSLQPDNEYVKFAVFGYGNSLMLHNILIKLAQKDIKKPYEIRIIGMDNRGTQDFKHVTCISAGEPLDRSEMEKHVPDIDIFLILYDKSRYSLSCSGSILESLSYSKPILHFDNDCINTFNKPDNPIGICCYELDEFVDKMEDIINNYGSYLHDFEMFRSNITKLRHECALENSLVQLKDSFTW